MNRRSKRSLDVAATFRSFISRQKNCPPGGKVRNDLLNFFTPPGRVPEEGSFAGSRCISA